MTAEAELPAVEVTLRDGRRVCVRALLCVDADEVLQAFGRLSADTRYMRFMRAVGHLDADALGRAVGRLLERGFAVVATVPAADGIDIVGGASCAVGNDPHAGEFAITIVDGWGGAGLGGRLMRRLIDTARRRGVRRLEGYVLATNAPMLRLAKALGFESRRDPDDYAVQIVRLELPG